MIIKRNISISFGFVVLAFLLMGCKPTHEETSTVYKIVAHRGGYLECNEPDCSIASLKYAIDLRCYASECDIVITKDNDILVVHPVKGNLVNGLEPYNHTVAEIRAAGKLANGEKIPTLREFIEVVMDKETNPHGMKIWLDVKHLTKDGESLGYEYSINSGLRAAEIIKEMGAEEYCEFLIPTGDGIINGVRDIIADEYNINIAWMTATHPDNYHQAWAQLAYHKVFDENSTYSPHDYINAGVPLSVYGVNTEERMDVVIPLYPHLKAIFTDYPNQLIQKLKQESY